MFRRNTYPYNSFGVIDTQRLADRIKQSGMTYAAIARDIGVKQPTISRLVKGEQQGTTHLHRLARVLGTTPAYLTGETDDPDAHEPDAYALSSDEVAWVEYWRTLTEGDRKALVHVVRAILSHYRPDGGMARAA